MINRVSISYLLKKVSNVSELDVHVRVKEISGIRMTNWEDKLKLSSLVVICEGQCLVRGNSIGK